MHVNNFSRNGVYLFALEQLNLKKLFCDTLRGVQTTKVVSDRK